MSRYTNKPLAEPSSNDCLKAIRVKKHDSKIIKIIFFFTCGGEGTLIWLANLLRSSVLAFPVLGLQWHNTPVQTFTWVLMIQTPSTTLVVQAL